MKYYKNGVIAWLMILSMIVLSGCGNNANTNTVQETSESIDVTADSGKEDITTGESDAKSKEENIIELIREGDEIVFSDREQALSLFEQAEKEGSTDATFLIGFVSDDNDKSVSTYEGIIDENPYAKLDLAIWTNLGNSVITKDSSHAEQLFKEAMNDIGSVNIEELPYPNAASILLGYVYFYGLGTEKDYDKAFEYLTRAANAGNASANLFLGEMYGKGLGVDYNHMLAKSYYSKAIKLGYEGAIGQIGTNYMHGEVFEKDYNRANEWFERGVELGKADCMNQLGYAYNLGLGKEQDYVKAKELYEKAIELNDSTAMTNLAMMYLQGEGVEKDIDKALELSEESASQGNAMAYDYLGHFYEEGLGIEQNYTKAKESYEKALELKESPSFYKDLANIYDKGHGVEVDPDKAKELRDKAEQLSEEAVELQKKMEDGNREVKPTGDEYLDAIETMFSKPEEALAVFEKEANDGNEDAEFLVGYMYYGGLSRGNWDKAKTIFEKLNNNNPYAKLCLERNAYYLEKDENDKKTAKERMDQAFSEIDKLMAEIVPYSDVTNSLIGDYYYTINENYEEDLYKKAFEYYEKSTNNPCSIEKLGFIYYNGYGVKRDMTKSIEYLEKAANMGLANSAQFLGRIYDKGMGVPADPQKAEEWFKKAEDLGLKINRD